jgi:GNAT superfamily N-acetyltransferase
MLSKVIGGAAIAIRQIVPDDDAAAAGLSAELGYPADSQEMRERIARVTGSDDEVVFVGCAEGKVIAWIDVCICHHLATGVYGEIAGFIVSDGYRSAGVGRKLIRQAEKWIAERGIDRVIVRSRTIREAAHRFYLREGYSQTKTSAVFSKTLNAAEF